ncbi:MAG: 2Fe-2S iron-sulfur cluster-binding protein [Polyangiaceae bacterium]
MIHVTIETLDDGVFEGTVDEGSVLGDFCDAHEAPVPFSCRSASCGTCRVVVLDGDDVLAAPEDEELEVLEAFGHPAHQRLACVARFRPGPGTLRVRPVRDDE